jgi:hypothetical protein
MEVVATMAVIMKPLKKKRREIMKSNTRTYRSIVTVAALFLALTASAQTSGTTSDESGLNANFNVVTELDRVMVLTNKKQDVPDTYDSLIPMPPITYTLLSNKIETEFEAKKIAAARLKFVEKLEKLYKGYVKAGIGTSLTPLFEFHYNELRSRKGGWGIYGRHLSSTGGIKNVGYNGFSKNELGLYGKQFIKDHAIQGGLDYKRDVMHHYGYDDTSFTFSKDSIRQRFNYIGAYADVASYYKDSTKLSHKVKLRYYNFGDLNNDIKVNHAIENNILLDAQLSKYMNKEKLHLDVSVDFNSYKSENTCSDCTVLPDENSLNNGIVRLKPGISTIGKNWKVKVGLGINLNLPDQNGNGGFHFYPDAEFKYSLFNNIFIPYVGITGGLKRNSFQSLASENPFLLSDVNLINTNQKYDIYGGIRGSVSSTTSFNLKLSQQRLNNIPLFFNDTLFSVQNRFGVVYDTADVFTVRAQVAYQKSEKLKLLLTGNFYSYNMKGAVEPWHLPPYKITFSGIYDLEDKFIVKADIFAVGSRKALSLFPVEGVTPEDGVYAVELKGYVDANLGIEYRYTKRLGAFLQFNNIAAQKYQRWNKFPTQGFNVLGGVSYSF